MKKTVAIIIGLLMVVSLFAEGTPQEEYVKKWASTAVREMYRSGVPASITLAQGILESRYGLSPLAAEGNNHFGIKCHKDWTGKTMAYDDDAKGECFRVYDSADESFQDHSDFLRYRDRYKFLFEFETTDYKAWAYGLKKAGYATDPNYPAKLIKYIEDYDLSRYDKMSLADAQALDSASEKAEEPAPAPVVKEETKKPAEAAPQKEEQTSKSGHKSKEKSSKKDGKKSKESKASKASKHVKKKADVVEEPLDEVIPESPLSIEEPKKISKKGLEEFQFSLSREAYSRNGVPFITSVEGETYASIAESNNLYLNEILKFNDLTAQRELLPGTIVYLQAKKNQSEKGLDKYIVDDDSQTLWEICQRFGVKMSSVEKMNGFTSSYKPQEGDTIVLRGKKKKN